MFKKSIVLSLFVSFSLQASQSSLDEYLERIGVPKEKNAGHMNIYPEYDLKAQFYDKLLKDNTNIKTIAEIGFCLGHSSMVYLSSRDDIVLTSFDLMTHWYCEAGQVYVERLFPGRFSLIKGDSQETVPNFHKKNPNIKFDLIIIDGGHDYSVAKTDLKNMKPFAHENTLLIMDDTDYYKVKQAWDECLRDGLVEETQKFSGAGFGWTLGRYK